MENLINFDPNLNFCGRMPTKIVRLTFGQWQYRHVTEVQVGGNCSGITNIEAAVENYFDQIVGTDGIASLVLTGPEGDLHSQDDENREEEWLKDMLIGAEIINISPQKGD